MAEEVLSEDLIIDIVQCAAGRPDCQNKSYQVRDTLNVDAPEPKISFISFSSAFCQTKVLGWGQKNKQTLSESFQTSASPPEFILLLISRQHTLNIFMSRVVDHCPLAH